MQMSSTRHIPLADAGPTVRDVMLGEARAISPDTPVADVRETFANPRVKLMLVADGDRYLGTVAPDRLDGAADGTIGAHADPGGPRVAPEDPVAKALALLAETEADRVPVVDADGRLHGLVCLNRRRSAFCASPLPR
jgi:CBS domain-containing protein